MPFEAGRRTLPPIGVHLAWPRCHLTSANAIRLPFTMSGQGLAKRQQIAYDFRSERQSPPATLLEGVATIKSCPTIAECIDGGRAESDA
jgi:hypothetical protein